MRFSSLVFKGLFRHPGRNGLALACVAAAVGVHLSGAVIELAGRRGYELSEERLGADLVAAPDEFSSHLERAYLTGEAALVYMDREVEDRIAAFNFVERTSPQLFIQSLADAPCCSAGNIFLIGFEPETDFTIRPWLARNRHVTLGPDDVIVGADFSVEAGDTLMFYGHLFRVAGTLDPSGSGLDRTCFIPLDAAYRMAEGSSEQAISPLSISRGQISAVMIKLKPLGQGGAGPGEAAYHLNKDIYEISVIEQGQFLRRVQKNLGATLAGLRAAGYALWPATALIIGLVFAMSASERRREIGIIRGIGATRAQVYMLLVFESAILAAAASLVGVSASLGLLAGFSRLIFTSLAVPFAWPGAGEIARAALLIAGAATATAVASASVPAWAAVRQGPYEAARRED